MRDSDRKTYTVVGVVVTLVLVLLFAKLAGPVPAAVIAVVLGGGLVVFLRTTHPGGREKPDFGIFFDREGELGDGHREAFEPDEPAAEERVLRAPEGRNRPAPVERTVTPTSVPVAPAPAYEPVVLDEHDNEDGHGHEHEHDEDEHDGDTEPGSLRPRRAERGDDDIDVRAAPGPAALHELGDGHDEILAASETAALDEIRSSAADVADHQVKLLQKIAVKLEDYE